MPTPDTFCHVSRLLPAENVGAVGANGRNPTTMRVSGCLGSGGNVGADWGQSGGTLMMKMIHFLSIPLSPCPARPAAHFAGCLQTLPDLSAKGFPLGTSPRAAICGVTAHHLDTLRTAQPELVASASTVTAWQRGTDAPSVSAPGAPPYPPGVPWHTPALWQHLDRLRNAWPDLVASTSTVTAWRCGTGGPGSVKSAPVDNFYSASILPTAEKMGIVDKVCKCLNSLNIPLNVPKVINYAQ